MPLSVRWARQFEWLTIGKRNNFSDNYQGHRQLLDEYLQKLNQSGTRIRVWSLVVTIFGDAIEPRGGVFRLGALQQITERIGIESNALRTAMSRLASDGWLERQRIGRASFYRPSQMASRENARASDIIYQFSRSPWHGAWIFALCNSPEGFDAENRRILHDNNFGFHGRKLAMTPDIGEFADNKCPFSTTNATRFNSGEPLGGNFQQLLATMEFHQDCAPLYREFVATAGFLLTNVENLKYPDGLEAIALRSLLVHNWRRIVLRDVHWPRAARPQHWAGFAAQNLVRQVYHNLLGSSEAWLNELDATPDGKLPEAGPDFARRFNE